MPDSDLTAGETGQPGAPVLSVRGVHRRFGGTHALRGVNIDIPAGQITALIGHNGAGKSTLLRVLSGADRPDDGHVEIDGAAVDFRSPHDALQRGVSAVYQELSMISGLDVAQNIFLGHERTNGMFLSTAQMRARAAELCERLEISVRPTDLLRDLPVAQRQLLEVAAAVNRKARFLLLDEPTTALESRQVDKLLSTVLGIVRDEGIGVLLIDHKLDEVFTYADRVFALSSGREVLEGRIDEITRGDVVQAIIGEHAQVERADAEAVRELERGAVAFEARNLGTGHVHDIDLTVHSGEILTIYGLMGSGRSSFLRTVAGEYAVTAGEAKLHGEGYAPRSIAAARRRGVVFVPEERKLDGIIPNLNVYDNVGIGVLDRFVRGGFINQRLLRKTAEEQLRTMHTRGDLSQSIVSLSGGNQQKALLARAVLMSPGLLLLDEPTKGVDIGAKDEIHRILRELADETGAAIIVVTSEEEEALALADTIAIFHDGTCTHAGLVPAELGIADLKRLAWGENDLREAS